MGEWARLHCASLKYVPGHDIKTNNKTIQAISCRSIDFFRIAYKSQMRISTVV